MFFDTVAFTSAGLLFLIWGLLTRFGRISLFDPKRLRDEKGLARWGGSLVIGMGAVCILAGGLSCVLPWEYKIIPEAAVIVAVGTFTCYFQRGLRRFVK